MAATIDKPTSLPLIIERGATWERIFTWRTGAPKVALNLLDFTARLQFRKEAGAPALFTLTETDGIVLGSGENNLAITISWERAALFDPDTLPYVYDLRMVSPTGVVSRPLQGTATITPQVTLPA